MFFTDIPDRLNCYFCWCLENPPWLPNLGNWICYFRIEESFRSNRNLNIQNLDWFHNLNCSLPNLDDDRDDDILSLNVLKVQLKDFYNSRNWRRYTVHSCVENFGRFCLNDSDNYPKNLIWIRGIKNHRQCFDENQWCSLNREKNCCLFCCSNLKI